jgi:hypothetical protein
MEDISKTETNKNMEISPASLATKPIILFPNNSSIFEIYPNYGITN